MKNFTQCIALATFVITGFCATAEAYQADFVRIRAGTFQMGSPDYEPYEPGRGDHETLHTVTLTKDFEMQKTEVTQSQWFQIMGTNPSKFKNREYCPEDYTKTDDMSLCPNHPVEQVSWDDVQEFIEKLNASSNRYTYRLPTEAEWEYAARAGTQTAYSFDDNIESLDEYGWHYGNSDRQTHRVGKKKPNPYGLYDMHGNVCEWVQDFYWDYYGSKDSSPQRDPVGPPDGRIRVCRGGNWNDYVDDLRSAYRGGWMPDDRMSVVGFRLVRTAK